MLLKSELISALKSEGLTYGGDFLVKENNFQKLYPFFDNRSMSLVYFDHDELLVKYEFHKALA